MLKWHDKDPDPELQKCVPGSGSEINHSGSTSLACTYLNTLEVCWEGVEEEVQYAYDKGGDGAGCVADQPPHQPQGHQQAEQGSPPRQEIVTHTLSTSV